MDIFVYGEDGLTLWALKYKIEEMLKKLGNSTPLSKCKIFYRPSFGRTGIKVLGEFDFIILTKNILYLGESKREGASEFKNSFIELRKEQKLRHRTFISYVECWFKNKYTDWNDFRQKVESDIPKTIPEKNTITAVNLQTILKTIKDYYTVLPEIKNVILYFYNNKMSNLPKKVCKNFELVLIEYPKNTIGNFIKMNI